MSPSQLFCLIVLFLYRESKVVFSLSVVGVTALMHETFVYFNVYVVCLLFLFADPVKCFKAPMRKLARIRTRDTKGRLHDAARLQSLRKKSASNDLGCAMLAFITTTVEPLLMDPFIIKTSLALVK